MRRAGRIPAVPAPSPYKLHMTNPPRPSAEDDARYPYWRANGILLPVTAFLSALGFFVSWPFLPLMLRDLGVESHLETWMGYIMLSFYVVSFITNPMWGGVADHFGRKIMVLRATLGMGFCMLLIPFAPSPIWFGVLFTIVGIFNGSSSALNALIVANTPPSRIGSSLAYAQTGNLVGRTAGPVVGAAIAAMIDQYHWMFWISGGMLLSAGLLAMAGVHEVKQVAKGEWKPDWIGDLKEVLAVPGMGLLFFLGFLFSVMWSGNVTIMSVFVIQLLEGQPDAASQEAFWIGAVAMGLSISSIVALPFWGRIVDRHDKRKILAFTTTAVIVCHVPLMFIETPLQLVIARVALGLTAVAMQPALVSLLREIAPKGMDARAISYGNSFQFAAMGLGPAAAGLIGPALGLPAYFGLTIILTLVGLLMWVRQGQRTNP